MHDDRRLVEDRLNRVLGERIWTAVYRDAVPLRVERWNAPGEPVPVREALAAEYAPAAVGDAWGPPWGTTWFRLSGRVPREWAGRTVEAVIDLGFHPDRPGFSAEGLVHAPDGTAIKGLNPRNAWVRIGAPARGGEEVLLHVEAAANPLILGPDGFLPTPLGDADTAGDAPLYRLARTDLAVFDEEVWGLAMDLEVLGQLMRELRWRSRAAGRSCGRSNAPWTRWTSTTSAAPPRPPASAWPPRWPPPRTPARTGSPPSGTPTSIRPGCGRCARRCARWRARRPTSSR